MKLQKFLNQYKWPIVIILTIITALVTTMFLWVDASRNIGEQINSVYEKERLVSQDFANSYELSGITCHLNDENNIIIFREDDCYLKATYSKNGDLLTKEFEDTRISSNMGTNIILVVATSLLGFFLSFGGCVLLDHILAKVEQKRLAKKK